MRTVIIMVASMAAFAVPAAGQTPEHVSPPSSSCSAHTFRSYTRAVYERSRITHRALGHADRLRACLKPWALRWQHKLGRSRRSRIELNALTPFHGPGGSRWAIPYAVVDCESHGQWGAANSSGAIGPYQLLGHGAPWPANTKAARLAHHRIARALYLAQGLGPWASSRGCWG